MAFTEEALEPYFRQMLQHNPNKYNPEPNLGDTRDYLTGKTNTVPVLQHNWFNEKFGLLAPLLIHENTPAENKKRLIDFFNEPALRNQIRYYIYNQLIPWMPLQDMLKIYEERHQLLRQLGWTNAELGFILKSRYGNLLTMENLLKPEDPLLKLISDAYKNMTEAEVNTYIQKGSYNNWDQSTALLLYVHHRDKCFEYMKNNERSTYSPYTLESNVMQFALQYEKEKYAGYYYREISSMTEETLQAVAYKFNLLLQYNDFVRVEGDLFRLSPLYLELLSNSKGRTYESGFNSSFYKINTDEKGQYMPLSGWALYLLLNRNEENGLAQLSALSAGAVPLATPVIEMLHYRFKNNILPSLIHQYYLKAESSYTDKDRVNNFIRLFKENKESLDFDSIWQFNLYRSKNAVNASIQFLIEMDPAAATKAIDLLQGKNADTRIAGARILAQVATPAALDALKASIETEKDDDARDIMLNVAGDEYLAGINLDSLAGIIEKTKKRGKLKKALTPWLEETELPALYFTSGRQLTTDEVRFILYRMSRVKELVTEAEIKPVVQQIDRGSSNAFALEIFKRYKEAGFEAKYKYLLGITTMFGNDDLISMLVKAIDEWIEGNRKAMAELGIQALALHSSNKALRWIEWYSRKYKSKKPNIGEAALLALENAAQEQGITIHELGDRIVPDFGFEGLFRHFQVNGEEYRAFIDSNFKIAFFNEDNKKIKTIPAAADASIKDEFKYISKEIRDIVKSQSSRLEYYLIIQRRWNHEQWKNFFQENPVMFIYATKLVWGRYDTNEQLTGSFICNEDTSLLDQNGEETELTGTELIGIVHPSQLDETSLQAWKKQLFDLSVEQVFPQLDRRVPDMEGIDLSGTIIKKFDDIHMVTGSIRSTLERFGWFKGPTGDGGYLESFRLLYFEKKIEAVVELDGVGVGYGWGGDEKTGRLYFLDKTKVKGRHGYINSETDEKLVKLRDLPLIFLQETLAAIESIKRVEKKAPDENN